MNTNKYFFHAEFHAASLHCPTEKGAPQKDAVTALVASSQRGRSHSPRAVQQDRHPWRVCVLQPHVLALAHVQRQASNRQSHPHPYRHFLGFSF